MCVSQRKPAVRPVPWVVLAGMGALLTMVVLGWVAWRAVFRTFQAPRVAPVANSEPAAGPATAVEPAGAGPSYPVSLFEHMTFDTRVWTDVVSGDVVSQQILFRVRDAIRLGGLRAARDGNYRRFFHTAWANPLPEQEIRCLDFIGLLEDANVLIWLSFRWARTTARVSNSWSRA